MSLLFSKTPSTGLAVSLLTELIFPCESSSLSVLAVLHCAVSLLGRSQPTKISVTLHMLKLGGGKKKSY